MPVTPAIPVCRRWVRSCSPVSTASRAGTRTTIITSGRAQVSRTGSVRTRWSKNTNIATYPSWTGVQALPGYGWVPPAGDSARNGVYQDFGTYVRNYPTRWGDVRASRVNEFNLGL